jgi:polyribonucleotide nucleotidyltransferase
VSATRVEAKIGGVTLSLETGKLAKQAHGAVLAHIGGSSVLAAAVGGNPIPGRDFFPLQVEYRERTYAAGRFPGGYIKRETRPSTKETLTSRLIDRPIRPLFPAGYTNEVQIHATVHSADKQNDPDVIALNAVSAALHVSPIPFLKPVGGVRVGRVREKFVVFPTNDEMEESDLDLVLAGTREAVCMIEGFARELPEATVVEAFEFAHGHILRVIDLIERLRHEAGLGDKVLPAAAPADPLVDELNKRYGKEFRTRYLTDGKLARYAALNELKDRIKADYAAADGQQPAHPPEAVSKAFAELKERIFQDITLTGTRIDGRGLDVVRPLSSEVGVLAKTHGSAVFQRGETQALVVATLGTAQDEQKVEGLEGEYSKKFFLDYNFPPFSVGECKPIRAPGRREIGHGMLAERSLKAVLPTQKDFPYTIRLVSEILESNGSSSMASVCGGTLAMMDAGVKIKQPVAGVSIGLVTRGDKYVLLTDIQGDEDHYGDMDFKVAGTQYGVTGIQLDIKLDGVSIPVLGEALEQARKARREILKSMLGTLRAPRKAISDNAPRLLTIQIPPDKIGLLIGPGGKTIRAIQEETGAKLDVEDTGMVSVAHSDAAGAEAARAKVEALCAEIKVGTVYQGKVASIKEFGAFVELVPGRDGLCHISELDNGYVGRVEDVVRVGDPITVKVVAIDDQGRVKLSRKALLPPGEGGGGDTNGEGGGRPPREDRGGDRGDRGDRGPRRDRGGDRGPRRDRD